MDGKKTMKNNVKYNLFKKCKCRIPEPIVINYSLMWRDGDVVCQKCKNYIKNFDAG